MLNRLKIAVLSSGAQGQEDNLEKNPKRVPHDPEKTWHCREYWTGDSRDGQYCNGDGYHYFEMKGDGIIAKALEYYETDEGEEKTTELPELVGTNWFEFFGFEDDELLETVAEHEFDYIEQLIKKL